MRDTGTKPRTAFSTEATPTPRGPTEPAVRGGKTAGGLDSVGTRPRRPLSLRTIGSLRSGHRPHGALWLLLSEGPGQQRVNGQCLVAHISRDKTCPMGHWRRCYFPARDTALVVPEGLQFLGRDQGSLRGHRIVAGINPTSSSPLLESPQACPPGHPSISSWQVLETRALPGTQTPAQSHRALSPHRSHGAHRKAKTRGARDSPGLPAKAAPCLPPPAQGSSLCSASGTPGPPPALLSIPHRTEGWPLAPGTIK